MEKRIPVMEWTVPIRLHHWIMVISIFVLIVTGFYIASPLTISAEETINKHLMGQMRFWHILFGAILTIIFAWRIYMAFFPEFHASWKNFLAGADKENLIKQLKFYLLISNEKPEHKYLYGPMQAFAYAGLFFMIFLIVVTGLILTGAGYRVGLFGLFYWLLRPVENLMGGLATVRFIHHILTWLFVLFIIVHVYMAFWYDIVFKEGTISSMISGVVFKKKAE